MTWYCDQCGSPLKEHGVYCSKCGAKCDLPPEKNEPVEEQVNNAVNDNTEHINENVNETVNNTTNKWVNNTNNVNVSFDFNNIDWNIVIKYSIVGTILSLLLGVIFFSLFYGNGMVLYSFIIGLIISVLLSMYAGNNTIALIVIGPICGYIGSVYLRDKINFPIINQYLGE